MGLFDAVEWAMKNKAETRKSTLFFRRAIVRDPTRTFRANAMAATRALM
jgi:hypothetical protein